MTGSVTADTATSIYRPLIQMARSLPSLVPNKRISWLVVTACLSLLVACAGPRAGAVSRDTYPAWPFIPNSGELYCDNGAAQNAGRQYVSIMFDGHAAIHYALNGSARDAGLPELDSTVWNGDRAATLGLVERGLALCD